MLRLRGMSIFCVVSLVALYALQCSTQQSEGSVVEESNGDGTKEETSDSGPAGTEVLVETIKLTPRTMSSYILLSSTVETESMVDVYSKIPGNVTELHVEEGQRVAKDELLVLLDDKELSLAEERAEVMFRQKESELKRVQESFDNNIISEVEYDYAKFTLLEAEVIWKQAKQNLSYTRVTAPIAGVISERFVKNGDRILNSTKLFQIVDTSDKIVRVFIPEKEIGAVRVGQEAVIITEFLDKKKFQGAIKRISPVVDPSSGTFKVTIGITDPRNLMRIGMFVSLRIITSIHENITAVPKDAIVYESGLPFVYAVRNNIAHKVLLKAGVSDELYVEAVSGISENEEIIIVGQSGLKDNTKVKVMSGNSFVK